MSYILDSLKKSDQERKRGSVPGVLSDHGGSGPEPGRPQRRRWSYLLGGGFLLLSGIVLAAWLQPWQPAGPDADVPVAAAPAETAKVAAAQPERPARAERKPPAVRPVIPPPPAVVVQSPPPPPPVAGRKGQEVPNGPGGWAQPRPGMSWGAPVAGGTTPGAPVARRPIPGATAPGDPVAGRPIAGATAPGAPVAGRRPVARVRQAGDLDDRRPFIGGLVPGDNVANERVVGGRLAGAPGGPEAATSGAEADGAPAGLDEPFAAPEAEEEAPTEAAPEAGDTGTAEPPEAMPEPSPDQDAGTASQPEALPKLEKMPPAVRSGLPEIKISAHFYSKKPASRLASVNGRIMREGQELEGLKVVEITPSGVVFLYNGRKFFVDVL